MCWQEQSNLVQTVLDILQWIVPPLTDNYQDASPMGSTARAQKALADLHLQAKKIEVTVDQLMVWITQHNLVSLTDVVWGGGGCRQHTIFCL